MKRWRLSLGIAAALAAGAAAPVIAAPGRTGPAEAKGEIRTEAPANVRYVVKPGDNLFRFAADYLIRQDDYRIVQRLNRVADPRRLPIGMVLVIPRELLRHELVRGTVRSVNGSVRIAGRPATVGMTVSEGMLIETGQKSFVSLVLPDATSIALPSQSAVRVQRLRKVVFDSHVERLFGIERGRASATVTPMTDPLSDFRFSTPRAVTSVRGTHFRMGYEAETGLATSEVLEGKVGFDAADHGPQALPAGYGTTSALTAPVELLPPPVLRDADAVQTGEGLRFALDPVAGARAYHVQIGTDAAFLQVLDETTASSPELGLGTLPDGAYFVRATAIDSNGLEGEPSVHRFERRLDRLRMGIEMGWVGPYRQYVFWWNLPQAQPARFRFQLVKAGRENRPVLDLPDLSVTSQPVIDLPRGAYRWRIMISREVAGKVVSEWSAWSELRVEAGR